MNYFENTSPYTLIRDYWRLAVRQDAVGGPNGEPWIVELQGRRRTTEAFWPPLSLPFGLFERFVHTMENAASVVDGFCDDPRRPMPPSFPDYEIVAACEGPAYWLKIAETSVGDRKRSAMVTIYRIEPAATPVIWLIDDDIPQFLQDLEQIKKQMATSTALANGRLTKHPIESVAVAVRDAAAPVRSGCQ